MPHIAAILLAALCSAEGVVLIKKFPPNPPIMINAIGLTIGGIILAVASLVSGEPWNLPTLTSTWIAWLYLVIFVTTFGFLLYLFALSRWSASKTSYGFVLIPLITIVVASTPGRGEDHLELSDGGRAGAGGGVDWRAAALSEEACGGG